MSKQGRREFLRHSGCNLALAAAGSALYWSACGGKKKEESQALRCNDTSGLDPAAVQTRKSLAYIEPSPHHDKNCANCRFFQSKGDKACGACTLMQGPIHPQGYCNSWVAKPA
ncbi:MAG: high-potential iron-sulfur protein [Polyangiales bacterium]